MVTLSTPARQPGDGPLSPPFAASALCLSPSQVSATKAASSRRSVPRDPARGLYHNHSLFRFSFCQKLTERFLCKYLFISWISLAEHLLRAQTDPAVVEAHIGAREWFREPPEPIKAVARVVRRPRRIHDAFGFVLARPLMGPRTPGQYPRNRAYRWKGA